MLPDAEVHFFSVFETEFHKVSTGQFGFALFTFNAGALQLLPSWIEYVNQSETTAFSVIHIEDSFFDKKIAPQLGEIITEKINVDLDDFQIELLDISPEWKVSDELTSEKVITFLSQFCTLILPDDSALFVLLPLNNFAKYDFHFYNFCKEIYAIKMWPKNIKFVLLDEDSNSKKKYIPEYGHPAFIDKMPEVNMKVDTGEILLGSLLASMNTDSQNAGQKFRYCLMNLLLISDKINESNYNEHSKKIKEFEVQAAGIAETEITEKQNILKNFIKSNTLDDEVITLLEMEIENWQLLMATIHFVATNSLFRFETDYCFEKTKAAITSLQYIKSQPLILPLASLLFAIHIGRANQFALQKKYNDAGLEFENYLVDKRLERVLVFRFEAFRMLAYYARAEKNNEKAWHNYMHALHVCKQDDKKVISPDLIGAIGEELKKLWKILTPHVYGRTTKDDIENEIIQLSKKLS